MFLGVLAISACSAFRVVPEVLPLVETVPVQSQGDAADDPAIWVHAVDPQQSRVLGADKRGGLYVYDLGGNELQFLDIGAVNNVDVRQGLSWDDRLIDLAAGTHRDDRSIALFEIGQEGDVQFMEGQSIESGFEDPYGLCLFHDRGNNALYVFAGDRDGRHRQWHLSAGGEGRIEARLVREFEFGSKAEGCVADDESAVLFVAQENIGIWRMNARPDARTERSLVDRTLGSRLNADVEGLSLYRHGERTLLLASSQGDDTFAVYDVSDGDVYLGSFRVGDNIGAGIDGAEETDGIDTSGRIITDRFPAGLLVVQDGYNMPEGERQNFKLVSMADVIASIPFD